MEQARLRLGMQPFAFLKKILLYIQPCFKQRLFSQALQFSIVFFSAAVGFVLYDAYQIMKQRTQNCRCHEIENKDE